MFSYGYWLDTKLVTDVSFSGYLSTNRLQNFIYSLIHLQVSHLKN